MTTAIKARFWDDIHVGDRAEFGSYEVTRDEVIDFASKYDPQPFHLDEEAAAKSLFGRLCASGWHTCAMMMRMMVDEMVAHNAQSLGSPGIDEIRWIKPVFPGDILRIRTEVLETRASTSRPDIGSVISAYEVVNDKDEIVMTMKGRGIFRRRPDDAA